MACRRSTAQINLQGNLGPVMILPHEHIERNSSNQRGRNEPIDLRVLAFLVDSPLFCDGCCSPVYTVELMSRTSAYHAILAL